MDMDHGRTHRYVHTLGKRGDKLLFAELDAVFRLLEGAYYERLTFGFAESKHDGQGEEVLRRARQADEEEMLCFLRWLDHDGTLIEQDRICAIHSSPCAYHKRHVSLRRAPPFPGKYVRLLHHLAPHTSGQTGDGLVSKEDFCHRVLRVHPVDPVLMGRKWVALKNLRMVQRSLSRPNMR